MIMLIRVFDQGHITLCELPVPLALQNKIFMKNLLYILAVIIVIAWAIGFIGYSVGGLIHILLVIALVSILLGIIQGRKV